jgi:hypothetical protein
MGQGENDICTVNTVSSGSENVFVKSAKDFVIAPYCTSNLVNTSWSDWLSGSCNVSDKVPMNRSLTTYDLNGCVANVTVTEFGYTDCDYCGYDLTYDTWSPWTNTTLMCGSQNRTFNDTAYDTCCAITGLSSDCYGLDNSTSQNTYVQTQDVACARQDTESDYLMLGVLLTMCYFLVYRKNRLLGSVMMAITSFSAVGYVTSITIVPILLGVMSSILFLYSLPMAGKV